MATNTPRDTEKSTKRRNATLATGIAAAVIGAATLLSMPAGASQAEGHVFGTKAKGAIDGSYIVMLKGGQSNSVKAQGSDLAKKYGGKMSSTYDSAINGFAAKDMTAEEARKLAGDSSVEKVVQNHTFKMSETQEDPPSYGLDRIDQEKPDLDKKYTFPDSAGEGVTAFIIDTGVRITHKDFGDRASHGFDAVDGDDNADDGQGHGTHVAGTVAGTDHGVAKKAKIVAVRVLDDQGSGTTEQVVAGIDWVTENAKGPSVANMSLGGPKDEALDAAVQKSIDAGITYGIAAGNETSDADGHSPARVKDAITVAASDDQDAQADFSNFGELVDIYAPGVDIVSAFNTSDDATETLSGTSMAAPHVTGGAALFLGENQDAKPADVLQGLTDNATKDAITNPSEGTPNLLLNVNTQ
jgi:subtilisin family serine protease